MIGSTLSHYKILAELGRGGMGIVYKAEDTKLDRMVAIKVLPSATLATDDDRARFYREAKAAAALHHPNIASVFEIDEAVPSDAPHDAQPSPFLAMEFIEGETLDARISKQPLKINEVIRLASEVAEGLKAAHGKEIVHRDIKSANIMIDADGRAKILDFGLAQTAHSTKLTRMGSTLGTMAYMSPEQAKGDEVDLRTDLWALGVVIYEMVTGAPPFSSDYEQAAVYSILNEEPEPITALRSGVPMALENVVSKCLAKDRKLRYASAADLLVDLERVNVGMSAAPHSAIRPAVAHSEAVSTGKASNSSIVVGAIGIVALAISLALFFMGRENAEPHNFEKLTLHLDGIVENGSPALSPDGQYLAFSGSDTLGRSGIFLQDLRTGSIAHISGSEGQFYPLFSPDSRRMTYSSGWNNPIYVVDVPTGSPQVVVESGYTGYWMSNDELIYSSEFLHKYTISSDSTELLHSPDTLNGVALSVFPGPKVPGKAFAVGNLQFGGLDAEPQLYTLDLKNGDLIFGDRGVINPQAISEDILLYQTATDNGDLFARRFEAETAQFTSPPRLVRSPMSFPSFHAGPDGSLIISTEASKTPVLVRNIWTADLQTKTLSRDELPYASSGYPQTAVISADSRFLLTDEYQTSKQTFIPHITDLTTGNTVIRHAADGLLSLSVSKDGLSYYARRISGYGSNDPKDQFEQPDLLLKMPINGRGRVDTLLASFDHVFDAEESSIGMLVTVENDSEDIRFIGLLNEDGTVDPISDSTRGSWSSSMAVSDDGILLAYESRIGSSRSMTVLNLISGQNIAILQSGRNLHWSPDGDYLYFLVDNTIRKLGINISGDLSAANESEIVLFVGFSFQSNAFFEVDPNSGDIIVLTQTASFEKDSRTYSTIEWWRGYADELDRILEDN